MALTSSAALRGMILEILREMEGGRASRARVLDEMEVRFKSAFSPEDLDSPKTRPHEANWRNRASFERASMVRDGILSPRADGVWELAPAENRSTSAFGWIVPSNPRTFNAEEAFRDRDEVDWSESQATISVGDDVYLYTGLPTSAITHRCHVIATGIPSDQVLDDREYWVDASAFEERQVRSWMRLRLIHEFDVGERASLTLDRLMKAGMKGAPQGRMRVPVDVMNLIREVRSRSRITLKSDDVVAESADFDPEEIETLLQGMDAGDYSVPTKYATSKTRGSAQRAFAQRVKQNYGWRCALTGITTPGFLVASHIVPWSNDESIRLDPANGICMSTLVDRAFDTGFLTIDQNYRVSVALDALSDDPALTGFLASLDGTTLRMPRAHPPNPEFLERRLQGLVK